ncbi:DUF1758 domain-containing protein [Trichonephila clavata]|uniref:DUF1758 domain-containing protein n=1 Tax=Trichonephila clavata TaxID=2740835 RepID=A0A8X6KC10_TRICU|nr:DUF1758 domain-containing protein [Trichonephila clavata]
MAFKLNYKKTELIRLAEEIGLEIPDEAMVIKLKNLIESSDLYRDHIDFVRELMSNIQEERMDEIELQKLKLSQFEKELELINAKKSLADISQVSETKESSSLTDNLECLIRSVKVLTIPVPVKLESGGNSNELGNRNAVGESKRVVGNKWQRTPNCKTNTNVSKVFLSETKNTTCVLCKRLSHSLSKCPQYRRLSVWERAEVIKRNNLCFRCFMPHKLSECRQVENCFCSKPHHSLIHFPREDSSYPPSQLKFDVPVFIPTQSEETPEAVSQSQLVVTSLVKGKAKMFF